MTDGFKIKEWRALIGLAMTMPILSIIISACLYLMFGWMYPLNLIDRVITSMGVDYISQGLVYVLFFSGPVFAFFLNASLFSRMRFETTNEKGNCWAAIRENWFGLAVLFLSLTVLITLICILFFIR